jgi:predicted amidophosphoribosyltransferase
MREGAIKSLLDSYKFDCQRSGYIQIADLMDSTLPRLIKGTIVMGVPSSSRAVRQRGFSHVELFAREFAEKRKLKYQQYLERASSETLHFLSKKERIALGASLFKIKDMALPETVLLVDDILTTGTTMLAATRLLKQSGVQHVYAMVIARQTNKDVWG